MKKWLVSSVSVLALLTLAACGGEDEEAARAPAETTTGQGVETAPAEVENAESDVERQAEQAGDAIADAARQTGEAAEAATEEAGAALENMADTANEAAQDAGDAAAELADQASQATEGAADTASRLGDNAEEAAGQAADGARDLADDAGAALDRITDGAGEALEGAAETAENAIAAAGLAGPLSGSRWAAPAIDDAFVAFAASEITGNSGCNRFNGTFEAGDDGALEIGPLASTRMACAEDLMTAEAEFLAALQSAAAYAIDGDTLTLSDANGEAVLTLNRAETN